MKRYLFLLVIAIFCLPNNSFAQGWSLPSSSETIDPSQGAMASTWFVGKYGGTTDFNWSTNTLKSAKKQKGKIPAIDIHRAIEVVTNDTTGVITARWDDGSTYIGEVYYGELKGMGTLTLADGGKYHGQWRFDRFHGVGTMEYADGGKYIGQWSWGKPHGQGTIVEPNGVKITAKFDEGIPRGKCIIQDVDGRLYSGRWSSGILLKKSIKPLEEEK